MARTITSIQNQILAAIAADPVLSQLNSPSQAAIYRLWSYIVASSQGVSEQLYDQFVSDVESVVTYLPPATQPWIQDKVFQFQYSATNPQIIQFSTASYTPSYPTINTAYQIVTNCSVSLGTLNNVNIKVAKGSTGSTAQPLASTELSALSYYLNQIKPAGINYNVTSGYADRLYTQATVYYQGAYSAIIANNLLSAYNTYLNNIAFGGGIKLVDIIIALRSVTGVNDVVINNMVARADSTSYGGGTVMVSSNTVLFPEYITVTGYIQDEDTSGADFISNLILVSQ